MFRFIKKLKAVKYWLKALKSASVEDYDMAYKYLNMAKKNGMKHLESVLLNAFLCTATQRLIEANDCLEEFACKISEETSYNDDEKKYLVAYAIWCSSFLPETYEANNNTVLVSADKYTLKNVSFSIQSNFPLPN
ncbi:MAG: hypothetical protein ACI9IA_001401 [Enterobacterales bacterium]|jgi:hypothetical protein